MVECARGGLGAREGLDRWQGRGCCRVGDALGEFLAVGSSMRGLLSGGEEKMGLGRKEEGGGMRGGKWRTVRRPSEMVPMNLQMVAVVRDMLSWCSNLGEERMLRS